MERALLVVVEGAFNWPSDERPEAAVAIETTDAISTVKSKAVSRWETTSLGASLDSEASRDQCMKPYVHQQELLTAVLLA